MSVEANKALVRRFVEEVLGRGNFAALAELAAPDCVDHAAPARGLPALATIAGVVVEWHAAFPDFRVTIEDLLAEGDRVVVHATLRGTHRGDFFGLPPTGRPLAVGGLGRYRLAGGRIVERWCYLDVVALCAQLGVPVPFAPTCRPGSGGSVATVVGPLE